MYVKINYNYLLGLILTASISLAAYAAGNIERGQAKSEQCIACHGERGVSSHPEFPDLAGQEAAYLQMQLNDFKTGKRQHPMMTPIAKTLSEQDIADLSLYYSKLTRPVDTP